MIRSPLPPLPEGPWHEPEGWLPQAAGLVDGAVALSDGPSSPELLALLGGLGAPLVDMVGAPFELRAALMGAAAGGACVHHELQVRIPVPEDLAPEVAVWDGDTVPEWRAGVLQEPKYFGFRQDVRLPAFHPNHRRRWRPHELLHTVVGFLWRPDLTRFEAYLGARLNELLPVVHWYGTAEILRARCPEHAADPLQTVLCRACEQAARPAWERERAALELEVALRFAEHTVEHLSTELRAIRREQLSGQRCPTPRPGLDASSDAVGYLRGHWNRLVSWSMGAWVEGFLVAGVDHETSTEALAERVARSARRLLGGELTVELERAEALRTRRLIQELAHRALLSLEWLSPGSRAHAVQHDAWREELEAARDACGALLDGDMDSEAGLAVAGRLATALDSAPLPEHIYGLPGALGATWWRAPGRAEVGQVVDGLDSALPSTAAEVAGLEELAADLAASEAFGAPGDLCSRFGSWLRAGEASPSPARAALSEELAADLDFEAWLRALPRQDLEADRFAEVVGEHSSQDPVSATWLRPHASLRIRSWPEAHAARWLSDDDGPPADLPRDTEGGVTLAAAWSEDLPQVLALDAPLMAVLSALQGPRGSRTLPEGPEAGAALELLLAHGLVVLVRPAR